jgi:hypothetical protein
MGLWGFRKNGKDKLTYCDDDRLEDLGRAVIKFVAQHYWELDSICDRIELVGGVGDGKKKDSRIGRVCQENCVKAGIEFQAT